MIREEFVVGTDTYTVFIADVDPVYGTCEVKFRKNGALIQKGTCTNPSEIPASAREIAEEILSTLLKTP